MGKDRNEGMFLGGVAVVEISSVEIEADTNAAMATDEGWGGPHADSGIASATIDPVTVPADGDLLGENG